MDDQQKQILLNIQAGLKEIRDVFESILDADDDAILASDFLIEDNDMMKPMTMFGKKETAQVPNSLQQARENEARTEKAFVEVRKQRDQRRIAIRAQQVIEKVSGNKAIVHWPLTPGGNIDHDALVEQDQKRWTQAREKGRVVTPEDDAVNAWLRTNKPELLPQDEPPVLTEKQQLQWLDFAVADAWREFCQAKNDRMRIEKRYADFCELMAVFEEEGFKE